MAEYASRGDHERTMRLLWGAQPAPARGPKQALTVAEIVAAAVAIADAEGLAGLSMRKVADHIGRSAMALYTYVPGKPELLDLMLDGVLAELPTSFTTGHGWRADAEAWARAGWAFYERHPWVLHVSTSRAVLGPHELDSYEAGLRVFDGIGLDAVEQTRTVGAVSGYVRGAAKAVADARAAAAATGESDDDWWLTRSALLDQLSDDEDWATRWGTSSRLQEEHAFDQLDRAPDDDTPYTVREAIDSFEFGLQRLLDGIEAHIAARSGRAGPPGG
jgi:AcrR family transcriptional regulator